MSRVSNWLYAFIILISLCLIAEGCSRHRSRSRNRDRYEQSENDYDEDVSYIASATREEMEEIAATDDYDKMLNELKGAIQDLKSIKKKYFAGKLTDNQLREEMDHLENVYQPIIDRLNQANDAGELNYKQHKKQVALFAAWIKEWESALSKVLKDFSQEFD